MSNKSLKNYTGPVIVKEGDFKDQILYLDDWEPSESTSTIPSNIEDEKIGILYLGGLTHGWETSGIRLSNLRKASFKDLLDRYSEIYEYLPTGWKEDDNIDFSEAYFHLLEQTYIQKHLTKRHINAKYHTVKDSVNVFMSHSSKDKPFVRKLTADLSEHGVEPWLDEYEIKTGQSIISELNKGIGGCDFLLLVASQAALESRWVQEEWKAAYSNQVQNGITKVLPIKKDQCELPPLLSTKKWLDFEENYNEGLNQLLLDIEGHHQKGLE